MKTKTCPRSLFAEKRKQPKFMLSNRFDVPSVYFKGVYYFPEDVKEYKMKNGSTKKGIQGIFHSHKLYQDTFYITDELLNEIIEFYSINN